MEDQNQAVGGNILLMIKIPIKQFVLHSCGDSNDIVCGKEFNGQFATNLKKHLKSCHDTQYKCFEIAEAKKKEKEKDNRKSTCIFSSKGSKQSKARQSSLPDNYFSTKQYDSKSKRHQAITLRLATFVGATNVSLSLIDGTEFRELIGELDPRFKIPHSKKLGIEIENLYGNVKRKISSSLQNAMFAQTFGLSLG